MLKPLLSLLAGTFLSSTTLAQTKTPGKPPDYVATLAAGLTASSEIAYKKIADRELQLHLFQPAGWKTTDKRPCFVIIHGGGWTGMEPRRMFPFAAHFARLGMLGISVQYQLASAKTGVTVFDCVKDARSAMRYVRAHAGELGIDPQKIIASGGSAGGHLAAATALFDGVNEDTDSLKVSPVPNALVLFFPVIDTSTEGYGNKLVGEGWQTISPLHQVRAGVPPTIIFHGTGDTTTPFKGAKAFHEAMLKAGNRSELVINEGGVHGYLMRNQALYDETMKKTEEFLAPLKLLTPPSP